MVPCPAYVLHQAIDHGVCLGQEFGRVSPQHGQAAELGGDMEDRSLPLLDLGLDDVPPPDVGAIRPARDIQFAGKAANPARPQADLAE